MLKKFLKGLSLLLLLTLVVILITNFWVVTSTRHQIHTEVDTVPFSEIGLVLGTSKRTTKGSENLYFKERIEAAALLYKRSKINFILVSGDNRTVYYNEPMDMYHALIDLGVPKERIKMDFGGTSTLESVQRAKNVYNHDELIIITQNFHCYRSLFIANGSGIRSRAFSADNNDHLSNKLAAREILARVKAALDLYIL